MDKKANTSDFKHVNRIYNEILTLKSKRELDVPDNWVSNIEKPLMISVRKRSKVKQWDSFIYI